MLTCTKYYRNDLDLLRALAIIAVVGYHLQIPYFINGYVGVDIFFVLSGFLMTINIFSRLKVDRFNLFSFYQSRARRILPVYFSVLLTFLILLFFFFNIKLYEYSLSAASSALFTSNFYYYLLSGYFQPKSELNLLLHTWSLSVEIQFYLICPPILILLHKCHTTVMKNIRWLLFILIFIGCMWMLHGKDQALNFYMLPSRLWEFLAGGFIFALGGKYSPNFSERITHLIGVIFLSLIILLITGVIPLEKLSWPNSGTLLLVLLTCSFIFLYHNRNFPRFSLIRYLARRSYGIYLWHWPLIVLSKYLGTNPDNLHKLIVLSIGLILAELSYRLIEKKTVQWSGRKLLAISATSIIIICLFVLSLKKDKAPLRKNHTLEQFYLSYPRNNTAEQFGFKNGHLRYNEKFSQFSRPSLASRAKGGQNYLLIGDCYAAMFAGTIREMAKEKNINLIQITADEVFPSKEAISKYQGPKELMNWVFNDFIPGSHQEIHKIILMSNYAGYGKKQLKEQIELNNQYFSVFNIPVIYIGQTEQYNIEVPVAIWLENRYSLNIQDRVITMRKVVNDYMKSIISQGKYIDIYLLSSIQQSNGRSSYIYDTEHFSTFGTKQYKHYLEEIFKTQTDYQHIN
ncbi:acyltransferase family protein [Pseudopedobacter sp.]|uniref:acyltransferase family protein n=1 Tax=Pseudopedobacter sp. TaxID=1936787 RepID=UPI003342BCE3